MDQEISVSAAGLKAMEVRLAELEGPKRREIAERIKDAREEGDLKENAEYHACKEEQGHLETEIIRLRNKIQNSVVTKKQQSGVVNFGSTVVVLDKKKEKITWTLVGSHERDVLAGKISNDSPVATALRDHKAGDKVSVNTPKGVQVYTIVSVK